MSGGDSPFHPGERAVQSRVGVRDRIEDIGRRVIRDHMPDQHREFFAQQPFLLVGSLDESGQPWASVVYGPRGFAHSPDPRTLEIDASTVSCDPLLENLRDGSRVGILGIQFETRRRNRANGRVEHLAGLAHFRLHVEQSFGNCAKYIQRRNLVSLDASRGTTAPVVRRFDTELDASAASLIARADTFFIASAYLGPDAGGGRGVDVSHRGGKPGFVVVEEDGALLLPDYEGNYLFNTLGNLVAEPRCGLVFFDFETGDTLQLAADAEILWEPSQARFPPGAQRMIRFRPRAGLAVSGGIPLRWSFVEYSPELERFAGE
jgi:predicted pyridoxine 5'-phosphate oxidase superfamily flavin-nucleotide-binding protein